MDGLQILHIIVALVKRITTAQRALVMESWISVTTVCCHFFVDTIFACCCCVVFCCSSLENGSNRRLFCYLMQIDLSFYLEETQTFFSKSMRTTFVCASSFCLRFRGHYRFLICDAIRCSSAIHNFNALNFKLMITFLSHDFSNMFSSFK